MATRAQENITVDTSLTIGNEVGNCTCILHVIISQTHSLPSGKYDQYAFIGRWGHEHVTTLYSPTLKSSNV